MTDEIAIQQLAEASATLIACRHGLSAEDETRIVRTLLDVAKHAYSLGRAAAWAKYPADIPGYYTYVDTERMPPE